MTILKIVLMKQPVYKIYCIPVYSKCTNEKVTDDSENEEVLKQ